MEPVITLAMDPLGLAALIMGVIIAIPLGVAAIIYLIVPCFKALGWIIRQVAVFCYSTFADILRLIGAFVTSIVLVPLTVGNVVVGRWSATAHYGRAVQAEFKNMGRSLYRLFIGNPARLLCLTPLTEGIERRIPQVMAAAPGPDRPARRIGQFDGYEIIGSLAGGGSGGRLYVARPDAQKLAAFARNGHHSVDQVVIKCFSLHEGTTLPQIVRENRALDAAKRLGLILEHDLNDERFHYVMRYVPGDSLNIVTQRLHAAAGSNGLGRRETHEVLSYAADLLTTLRTYHDGGLWHKDVKPDNVIVHAGHAHLVDFGLVTPLRSSMTLTTHGTEYFRDPEMVRMALKGVKVHEVDGAKFDLYAVGAVLFSMIENSFPAHGGLSQITRPCPETVRWIVRRAMADYDKRYQSAAAMLADIQTVLTAADPFALRLAHLPSVASSGENESPAAVPPPLPRHSPAYGAAPYPGADSHTPAWSEYPGMNPRAGSVPPPPAAPPYPAHHAPAARVAEGPRGGRVTPDLTITHWLTGRYAINGAPRPAAAGVSPFGGVNAGAHAARAAAAAAAPAWAASPRHSPRFHPGERASAPEQLRHARERAAAARQRIQSRVHARRANNFPSGVNAGVVVAVLVFLSLLGVALVAMLSNARTSRTIVVNTPVAPAAPEPSLPVIADMPNRPAGEVTVQPASSLTVSGDPRLLVICEWSKFDQERQALIASQIESLSNAGFLLLGDFVPATDLGSPFDATNAELVAELRAAVGTRLFLSPDARDNIRAWMDTEHDADAVVWFAGAEPGKPTLPATAWLIGSSGTVPDVLYTATNMLARP